MFGLRRLLLPACLGLLLLALPLQAEPLVHVVYKGQRLGSIAKRYRVSIDELCRANDISRRDPIKPGQRLIIPGHTQPSKKKERKKSEDRRETKQRRKQPRASAAELRPRKHTVYKGQTLGAIAKRYHVTVDAICHANRISRSSHIKPGQVFWIPSKADTDGSYTREHYSPGTTKRRTSKRTTKRRATRSWDKYKKPPWRRGYVHLVGYNDSYKGYVIGPKNQVLPLARQKISKLLAATGERPRIHRRLIDLISKVSDTFGGRKIRVVSGYRERSYAAASRHKTGRALDFSIPGVPNTVLRDYIRTLNGVGVGYYPNSSFVHLDVREANAYWVDYSGPGQAPRYRARKATTKEDQDEEASKAPEPTEDSQQEKAEPAPKPSKPGSSKPSKTP